MGLALIESARVSADATGAGAMIAVGGASCAPAMPAVVRVEKAANSEAKRAAGIVGLPASVLFHAAGPPARPRQTPRPCPRAARAAVQACRARAREARTRHRSAREPPVTGTERTRDRRGMRHAR